MLIEGLKDAGKDAEKIGITLVLEALNRFEACLVNKIRDLIKLDEEVNLSSVKIMCDLFHMNIEEKSIDEAILLAGSELAHVHFADSNREAPGMGLIDFKSVMRSLKEIKYDGDIVMELLPLAANPYSARERSDTKKRLDLFTFKSLDWIKKIAQI